MQPVPVSLLQPIPHPRTRTALIASADRSFRQRLSEILTGLRWQVREAEGGAQAWSESESATPEAIIVDSWLPDLDLTEFLSDFRGRFPNVDVVSTGGETAPESPRGPFRQELLYALRRSQDSDTAVWNVAPVLNGQVHAQVQPPALPALWPLPTSHEGTAANLQAAADTAAQTSLAPMAPARSAPARPVVSAPPGGEVKPVDRLPELIGNAAVMLEVSRRIRLVAIARQPVRQFLHRRVMVSSQIPVRQDTAQQQRIIQIGNRSDCFRNIVAFLKRKYPSQQRNVTRAQRLWKCHPQRSGVRHPRHRERSLIGPRAVCSHCPCAIPRSGRLPVCGGRERPRKDRSPGNQRPGCRKAGERVTDPSHAVSLAAPAMRRNPIRRNEYSFLIPGKETRHLPAGKLRSRSRLPFINCASQQPQPGPCIPPQRRVFQHVREARQRKRRQRAGHTRYA